MSIGIQDKPKHILIVDDDKEICNVVSEYLSRNQYKVSTAGNGEQLSKVLDHEDIDLILLDIMLPGEDGLTLCKKIYHI